MSKEEIKKELAKLAQGSENRKNTAKLEEVFLDIEAALKAGVSRQKVLEVLNENDIKMTLNTFNNAMYRLRKKHAGTQNLLSTKGEGEVGAIKKEVAKVIEIESEEEVSSSSHNPKTLDNIINSTPDLDALAKLSSTLKRTPK
ncbi:hypothetical protein [Undibacterium sp.]|uniref:hypothetical protein n=1 Tax=Undibacterium sp. TaxID=1914977 RepID=UPI0037510790